MVGTESASPVRTAKSSIRSRGQLALARVGVGVGELHIVGLGAGPFVVGLLNDQPSGRFGPAAIRYSLSAVALMSVIAGWCFLRGCRTLRGDLRAAEG